jgi:hypothetical protein
VQASQLLSGDRGAALIGIGRFVERPGGTDIALRIRQTGESLLPILVLFVAGLSLSAAAGITVIKTQHFWDARYIILSAAVFFLVAQRFVFRFNNRPTDEDANRMLALMTDLWEATPGQQTGEWRSSSVQE